MKKQSLLTENYKEMVSPRHKRTTEKVCSHSCNSVHNICANCKLKPVQISIWRDERTQSPTPSQGGIDNINWWGREVSPCESIMLQTHPFKDT